jgi:hypothetical protein
MNTFRPPRITLVHTSRPPTVEGCALMLLEAFAASRLSEAKELPGFMPNTVGRFVDT